LEQSQRFRTTALNANDLKEAQRRLLGRMKAHAAMLGRKKWNQFEHQMRASLAIFVRTKYRKALDVKVL